MSGEVNSGDERNLAVKMFFISWHELVVFGMFLLSPVINCFFYRKSATIQCARWAEKKHVFYDNAQPKSNCTELPVWSRERDTGDTSEKSQRDWNCRSQDCGHSKRVQLALDAHIEDLASVSQVHNRFNKNSNISTTTSHAQLICLQFIKLVMGIFRTFVWRSLSVTAILKIDR